MFIERLRGCSRDALRIEALLTLRLVRLPWIETKQWRQWQHWCSWNKEIVQHFEVKQCQAMRFEQKPPYSCGSNTLHQRSKAWSSTNPGAMIHDPVSLDMGYVWITQGGSFQHISTPPGFLTFWPSSVILGRDDKTSPSTWHSPATPWLCSNMFKQYVICWLIQVLLELL